MEKMGSEASFAPEAFDASSEPTESTYEKYQEKLKEKLPVLKQFVEHNIDVINSVGFLMRQNEDTWGERVNEQRETVYDLFQDEEPLLTELAEKFTECAADDEKFEDRIKALTKEQVAEIYDALAARASELSRQKIEFNKESDALSSREYQLLTDPSASGGGGLTGRARYFENNSGYYLRKFEEEFPRSSIRNGEEFWTLMERERRFKIAQKEHLEKKKREPEIRVEDEKASQKGEALFGAEWQKNLIDLVPPELRHLVRKVSFTDKLKDEGIGGEYDPQRKFINISTFYLDPNLTVKTIFHEWAHAMDDAGSPIKIYKMRIRFLEAMEESDNRFSNYAARTYEGEDGNRPGDDPVLDGMSEDLAESIAYFFSDPQILLDKNPERYRAVEDIFRDLYPEIDIIAVQETVASVKSGARKKEKALWLAEVEAANTERP